MTKIIKSSNSHFSSLNKIQKILVFFHKTQMKIYSKFARKLNLIVVKIVKEMKIRKKIRI